MDAFIQSKTDPTEAASPFLQNNNIQYAFDSTSLGWLKTCPRLYYYNMIQGWQSNDESVHLRFGIEYHRALQDYDISRAAGIPYKDAVHDVVQELVVRLGDWHPDHKYKNKSNLIRTVIWYLDKFEDDPAKTYIMADGRAAVEVSFRFELDWGPASEEDNLHPQPFLLCGHLDRVVTFNDDLYVMDRKTTTSTPSDYYFNQFEPNNQMSLYTLASQVIFQSPIKGVIIDAAQVAIDFSRFTRGFTYRTKDQIEEYVLDLHYWFAKAEDYANANYWPMNDTACDKFGGCRYRQICSKSPQVREQFLKSNFVKGERWNPLKPR